MSYQTPFPIAIVSDWSSQATSHMIARYYALLGNVNCIPFESLSLIEASGNIVDALDAFMGHKSAIVCNLAPQRDARDTNDSAIVYGMIGKGPTIIISTAGALGLLKKLVPDFTAREVRVSAFLQSKRGSKNNSAPNFHELEVIPLVLLSLIYEHDCSGIIAHFGQNNFPLVEPSIWLVDLVRGKPANLKLTILRDEADWFEPGNKVAVQFGESGSPHTLICHERLSDIPEGEVGICVGSSGLGNRRFLEIAVMGGSAAEWFDIRASGTKIIISKKE